MAEAEAKQAANAPKPAPRVPSKTNKSKKAKKQDESTMDLFGGKQK